jgi:rhomboid family GlyGly-CTERM serine protease
MAKSQDSAIKPYHFTIVISIVCIALYALAIPTPAIIDTNELLNYQYDAINHGELWRLVSGNLLHTNGWHLAMNLAGFWVIVFLHEIHYKHHTGKLMVLFTCLCILEGIGLFLFYPSLKAYVGLSGLLHGLFTFGAIMDIRKGFLSGYLLLLGVIAKVAYEQYFGASDGISSLINARVATESHLVGVVSGLICAFVWSPLASKFKHSK